MILHNFPKMCDPCKPFASTQFHCLSTHTITFTRISLIPSIHPSFTHKNFSMQSPQQVSHSQSQISTLLSSASQSENWDINVQILDLIQTKPDECVSVLVRDIKRMLEAHLRHDESVSEEHVMNLLTLLDSCLKNSNKFFLHQYRALGLEQVVVALQKSQSEDISQKITKCTSEWEKEVEGWNESFPAERSTPPMQQQSQSGASLTTAATTSTAFTQRAHHSDDRNPNIVQPQKVLRELGIVKDSVQLLNDIVDNAESFEDIRNATTFQLVANVREMIKRLRRLIDAIPEEKVLLSALTMHEYAFDTISNYDAFKQGGERKEVNAPPTEEVTNGDGITSQSTTTTSSSAPPKTSITTTTKNPSTTTTTTTTSSPAKKSSTTIVASSEDYTTGTREENLLNFGDWSPQPVTAKENVAYPSLGGLDKLSSGGETSTQDTQGQESTPFGEEEPSAPQPAPISSSPKSTTLSSAPAPSDEGTDPFAAISKRKRRSKPQTQQKELPPLKTTNTIPSSKVLEPNDMNPF
mmetsp:Transcript_9032/g.33323  ORF Transcript_9032/g.33323 Transcript_9032/m.33323 type:complete len:523 (-) Transcript_9032:39-1607(-)